MPLHHTPFLPDWVEHGTSSQHGWLKLRAPSSCDHCRDRLSVSARDCPFAACIVAKHACHPAAITAVIVSLRLTVSARDCPFAACIAAKHACLEHVAAASWPVRMLRQCLLGHLPQPQFPLRCHLRSAQLGMSTDRAVCMQVTIWHTCCGSWPDALALAIPVVQTPPACQALQLP